LKKVRDYDSRLQGKRRGELTAAQKDELDKYENQIVSLRAGLSWRTQAARNNKLRQCELS
jgi:hypothetical protein